MPNQSDLPSYCVVQWDDDKEQFAVVHTGRSKTFSTVKIGASILFEGNERERRRGKVLFLGSKNDCIVYGFDLVEDDTRFSVTHWSREPGLQERIDEVSNAIRNNVTNTLRRTASSSSTTGVTKQRRKKLAEKNFNEIDEQTTVKDKCTSKFSTSTARISSSSKTANAAEKNTGNNAVSNLNIQTLSSSISISPTTDTTINQASSSSSTSISPTTATITNQATSQCDKQSYLEENKSLKEKVLQLQNELFYLQETSVRLPSEETYNFCKGIISLYDRTKSEHNTKAIEIGKKLPCSPMELMGAKASNPSATINRLVKCCFKDIDLNGMCYDKLKNLNSALLDQIYEYVKLIHAPTEIKKAQFSSAISLRCRHVRHGTKKKLYVSPSKKLKNVQNEKQHTENEDIENDEDIENNENVPDASNEVIVEDATEDKENSIDIF